MILRIRLRKVMYWTESEMKIYEHYILVMDETRTQLLI